MDKQCTCSQDERVATGWGFRRAQWATYMAPLWIRIHYGCDRPLYGHNHPMITKLPGPRHGRTKR